MREIHAQSTFLCTDVLRDGTQKKQINNMGSSVSDAKLNVQNIVNNFYQSAIGQYLKHLDMKGI